jgi:hypothetical protein
MSWSDIPRYFTVSVSPQAFAPNLISGAIETFMIGVHCFILCDKFHPRGNADRDPTCLNDLLMEKSVVWPNTGQH